MELCVFVCSFVWSFVRSTSTISCVQRAHNCINWMRAYHNISLGIEIICCLSAVFGVAVVTVASFLIFPILSSWLSSTDYYCYRMSSSSDSNPKSIRNKLKLKSFNNNRRTTNIHFVFPFCSYQFMIALVHQPHLCFAKSIWNIRVLRLTSQKSICCSPSLSFSLVRSQSKKMRELVSRLLRFPICVTIIVIVIVVILFCLVWILWCQLACLLAQSNV